MSIVKVELYSVFAYKTHSGIVIWFSDLAMNGIFYGVVLVRERHFLFVRMSIVRSAKQVIN